MLLILNIPFHKIRFNNKFVQVVFVREHRKPYIIPMTELCNLL